MSSAPARSILTLHKCSLARCPAFTLGKQARTPIASMLLAIAAYILRYRLTSAIAIHTGSLQQSRSRPYLGRLLGLVMVCTAGTHSLCPRCSYTIVITLRQRIFLSHNIFPAHAFIIKCHAPRRNYQHSMHPKCHARSCVREAYAYAYGQIFERRHLVSTF